jgi:hypothetical protein
MTTAEFKRQAVSRLVPVEVPTGEVVHLMSFGPGCSFVICNVKQVAEVEPATWGRRLCQNCRWIARHTYGVSL